MNPGIDLSFSIADQHFQRTKSVGILNFSVQFLNHLAQKTEIRKLTVFNNSTLSPRLDLPNGARQEIHDGAISGRLGRMRWDQWGVYSAARRAGNEWLFLPKGFASFIRQCPVRLSGYLADVMPEYYQRRYPRESNRIELNYFLHSMRAMLRQAAVVFTNSDFSREEVTRVARERGWPAPRLRTMGIGFLRPSTIPPKEERILVLASPFPHKRTAMAVEFLMQWQKSSDYSGAIHWIGKLPPGLALPSFPHWKHDPRLEEAEYRDALAKARVLVFTSEYEGFGMPPVEAALAGACPVFSSIPPTLEVMRESGFGFTNDSYPSFSAALNKALLIPREAVDAWAAELFARHNWDKVTRVFLDELQDPGASREPV